MGETPENKASYIEQGWQNWRTGNVNVILQNRADVMYMMGRTLAS